VRLGFTNQMQHQGPEDRHLLKRRGHAIPQNVPVLRTSGFVWRYRNPGLTAWATTCRASGPLNASLIKPNLPPSAFPSGLPLQEILAAWPKNLLTGT
jgi:hypothetical protein